MEVLLQTPAIKVDLRIIPPFQGLLKRLFTQFLKMLPLSINKPPKP
jgi:hypothetical protein